MNEKVKVAIVGTGNVANGMHLPSWNNIFDAEVVAVCDTNKEFVERTAKDWGIPHVYTDFNELLEESEVKVIDLCTPPATHAPLSTKAMDAGLNVLLEKPMSMSMEESENILKEYKKREGEVKLCVIHNYLFSPSMLEIKSALERKKVEILGVDVRMLHTPYGEMISDKNHWVHSLPGGRFGECLIHPVYILQNLIGDLNLRDVYTSKRGSYDWVKYDELHVTFNSNRGFGSIYISFNSPRETSFPTTRVYGKNTILNFDGTNSTLLTQDNLNTRSKTGRFKDSLGISTQILTSTMGNTVKVIRGEWKLGHENLFRFFLDSMLSEEVKLPYTPEEAFEANKTFLEVLNNIS